MCVTASSEAPPAGTRLRALSGADAPLCLPRSAEAGWNQSEADWRFMLGAGEGIGLEAEGALVATTIVLPFQAVRPHPPLAWISMVLVTPAWRGRGLATWLMRRAIRRVAELGAVAVLDATPAGREVYKRLGFADGRKLIRLRAPAGVTPPVVATPDRLGEADLREIVTQDRAVAAFDRSPVLRYLAGVAPESAFVLRGGVGTGYALGRPGRLAFYVGPVVAPSTEDALALVAAAIRSRPGEAIMIDAFADQASFCAALKSWGFAEERPYTRMHLGEEPGGTRALGFAAAGPELG
jgi:GNAT superfamily N-acetyltransferase